MKTSSTQRLTESAIMLAFATVLSFVKIFTMPFDGSVTAFSMLPILLIAYRYRTRWGLCVGAAYALIQMLFGLDNLKYATNFGAAVSILLFDYLLAFVVLGFGGIFRDRCKKNQPLELALGCMVSLTLCYLSHCVVGYFVWGMWAPEGMSPLYYSVTYNAAYMLPELIITALGCLILGSLLDFRTPFISKPSGKNVFSKSLSASLTIVLAFCFCAGGVLYFCFQIINRLLSADFAVNYPLTAGISLGCIAVGAVLALVSRRLAKKVA